MNGPNLDANNNTVRGILVSAMNSTLRENIPVFLQSFTTVPTGIAPISKPFPGSGFSTASIIQAKSLRILLLPLYNQTIQARGSAAVTSHPFPLCFCQVFLGLAYICYSPALYLHVPALRDVFCSGQLLCKVVTMEYTLQVGNCLLLGAVPKPSSCSPPPMVQHHCL